MRHRQARCTGRMLSIVLAAALVAVPAVAGWAPLGTVQRVNVAYDGGLANGESNLGLAVSEDGRYVAFASYASNLVEGDTNARYDIFRRDLVSQETTLVNVTTTGGFSTSGAINYVDMTPDGRYVLFVSQDSAYVSDDSNSVYDVFVRDMVSCETTRVSTASDGTQANWHCVGDGSLSDDGRFVAYSTEATNMYPGDSNSSQDVIVKDLQTGASTCESLGWDGDPSNNHSFYAMISGDGTKVAFLSYANDIVSGDVNDSVNLFVRDIGTDVSERVDAATDGGESVSGADFAYCDLDYSGRYVTFASRQSDIVSGPVGVNSQVYLRDTQSDETTVVARTYDGNPANNQCYNPSISSDGRWVSFVSGATNLLAEDTNGVFDAFLRDMQSDTIEKLTFNEDGEQLNGYSWDQVLSPDGSAVAFNSVATNIGVPRAGVGNPGHIYVRVFLGDPPNTAPVALADAFETAEDTPLSLPAPGVLANDTDADGDTLTAWKLTDPAHGALSLATDGSFTYTPDTDYNGTDSFTYRASDGAAHSNTATVTITVTPVDDLPPVIPIAGEDRFATAVAASMEAYPAGLDPAGERTVVIATGRNWPDALGGSSLAGVLDAPILLVDTNAVPAAVTAEITRLGAQGAIILGGASAVSSGVEDALKLKLGEGQVDRIAGANRYETADKIAKRVIELQGAGYDGTAFVATGAKFPDALGAAPLAAANGWPLFLANPVSGLSAATVSAMDGVEQVLVLGGSAVVSQDVEDDLIAGYGGTNVTRLDGADRYETAAVVSAWGVDNAGLQWNRAGIATGTNFPDALAGGVLQGKVASVLMLTKPDALDPYTASALAAHKAEITTVTFFGGTGAITQAVRDQVDDALE